ncbi:MAG: HD-GYP domain-containing protein, partial [Micromonosporaceae bacterium]
MSGADVRTAEVIGALSLATDYGVGLPLEHGLHSALTAVRLAERLGVGAPVASAAYYGSLLFYVGCTVDAEVNAELFDDGELLRHFNPVIFGSPAQTLAGIVRALAGSEGTPMTRTVRVATTLPRAVRGHQRHVVAMCEVARMLTVRLGLPESTSRLFDRFTDRWDRHGDDLPVELRIVHVARDLTLQRMIGGDAYALSVVAERGGHAFDPAVTGAVVPALFAVDDGVPLWEQVVAAEPGPPLYLTGEAVDEALSAMGDFADLASPYLVGHSAGVARLAADAARACGYAEPQVTAVRRAGYVHDIGRVAVSPRVWQKPGPLSAAEWEQVRLHPYHGERILCRSALLAGLARIATCHHERLDGSGYHRGLPAPVLEPGARLLAAADAYHSMTEPRAHRPALPRERAAALLTEQV